MYQSGPNLLILVLFISLSFLGLAIFFIKLVYTNNVNNAKRQTELYKAMMLAQERERERLAKDLHDSLGPKLSFLRLENDLLAKAENPDSFRERALNSSKLISEVQFEMREVSHNLIPRDLEKNGLAYELDKLQYKVQSSGSLNFILNVTGLTNRFSLEVELNLFRILQELINNTIKHANAKDIYLSIEKDNQQLILKYSDNGIGFDNLAISKVKRGIGLENLQTRVNLYRGTLIQNSNSGNGLHYLITFPLQNIQ